MVRERVGIVFLWLLPCNCSPKYRNSPMNGNANFYTAHECDYERRLTNGRQFSWSVLFTVYHTSDVVKGLELKMKHEL